MDSEDLEATLSEHSFMRCSLGGLTAAGSILCARELGYRAGLSLFILPKQVVRLMPRSMQKTVPQRSGYAGQSHRKSNHMLNRSLHFLLFYHLAAAASTIGAAFSPE